jgi:hypothetical protein
MILSAPLRAASASDIRSRCAPPAAPNQRTHGPRCSVSPGLTRVSCLRPLRRRCVYFGKCRKEFRCQRVADSTGETTPTLGRVSKLRGSHRHHLLRYGNNAFLRDGPKVNLFKTAHRAILLCLDYSRAGRRMWLLNSMLRRMRQRAFVILNPMQRRCREVLPEATVTEAAASGRRGNARGRTNTACCGWNIANGRTRPPLCGV